MKGVMAFITCIMFGRTPFLACEAQCSVTRRICPFDGLAAMT